MSLPFFYRLKKTLFKFLANGRFLWVLEAGSVSTLSTATTWPLTIYGQVCELMKKGVEIKTRITSYLAMVYAYQANAIFGMVIEWHRQDFTKSAVEMNQLLVHILYREFKR